MLKFLQTKINQHLDLINIFILNIFLTILVPVEYSMWTDRDLFRAKTNMLEPLGAELSFYNGDRIPGGLLNFLWGIIIKIYDNPMAIYISIAFNNNIINFFLLCN